MKLKTMKQKQKIAGGRWLVLLAALLALLALGGCKAAEEIVPGPTPKPATPQVIVNHELVPNEHIITVSGRGEAIVSPDFATLTLNVQNTADTAEQANASCEENLDSVYEVALSLGVLRGDITDTGISITAQQRESDGAITGYLAAATITIIANDLTTASSVMSGIIDTSAGELKSITYGITDASAAYQEALLAAMEDARLKATSIAGAAGASLGAVVGVEESSGDDSTLVGVDFESSAIAVPARVTVSFLIGAPLPATPSPAS